MISGPPGQFDPHYTRTTHPFLVRRSHCGRSDRRRLSTSNRSTVRTSLSPGDISERYRSTGLFTANSTTRKGARTVRQSGPSIPHDWEPVSPRFLSVGPDTVA